MKCPYCNAKDTRVIDSRPTEEGAAIRRRRECDECNRRFTTYEKIEEKMFTIIKKDGRRQAFDRNKVRTGLIKACEKRPVTLDEIDSIVDEIERHLSGRMDKEIKSKDIGEIIMDKLRELDEVAYVRFASVYRQFTDVKTFIAEIEELLGEEGGKKRNGEKTD